MVGHRNLVPRLPPKGPRRPPTPGRRRRPGSGESNDGRTIRPGVVPTPPSSGGNSLRRAPGRAAARVMGGACAPPRGAGRLGGRGWAPRPSCPARPAWLWCSCARSGSRLGTLQAATADFNFKPGFNLERCGQPNIRPNSRFALQSMASSRAERIGPGDLMPGSGRGYPHPQQ